MLSFGRKAYRRPLSAEDIAAFVYCEEAHPSDALGWRAGVRSTRPSSSNRATLALTDDDDARYSIECKYSDGNTRNTGRLLAGLARGMRRVALRLRWGERGSNRAWSGRCEQRQHGHARF